MTDTYVSPTDRLFQVLLQEHLMINEETLAEILAEGENFRDLLWALESIKRGISYCVSSNIDLVMGHPRAGEILSDPDFWTIIFNQADVADAMLQHPDPLPGRAWQNAMRYAPYRRAKVADRFLARNQNVGWIATYVPERAERAWKMLWADGAAPHLNRIQAIAEANPEFRERVAYKLLSGYPSGKLSRKSLAWVKRYGTPDQKMEARRLLGHLANT